MKYRKLPHGDEQLSTIGLGLGNIHSASDDEIEKTLDYASITASTSLMCAVAVSVYMKLSVVWQPNGGIRFTRRCTSALSMKRIGVPLYACGGGKIPLLQQWLNEGMSMGSVAAFMITGPAIKITNLGAVKIVLGMKRFAFYIMFSMLFAFITGLVLNIFLR